MHMRSKMGRQALAINRRNMCEDSRAISFWTDSPNCGRTIWAAGVEARNQASPPPETMLSASARAVAVSPVAIQVGVTNSARTFGSATRVLSDGIEGVILAQPLPDHAGR